ncbi:tetraspanin-8 isoform X2 [Capsicum chacoense]
MIRENPKRIMIFMDCVTIAVSLAAIGCAIWLHFSDSNTPCEKVWEKPLLIVGVSVLVVWGLGFVWSSSQIKFFFWIYLISSSLVYFGAFCLMVFSILVTNRNVSRALFGRGGDYSHYLLQKYVLNAEQINSCLADFEFCQRVPSGKGVELFKYSVSDIQLSCCKLPTYCDLEFHNATYLTMPKAGPPVADSDCVFWSNVQRELCFDCQLCKRAFLDNITKYWKIVSLVSFVLFLVLRFVYCIVHCVLKNRSKVYKRNKVYPV